MPSRGVAREPAGGRCRTTGLVGAVSGSSVRRSQLSLWVFAVLNPPCSVRPLFGRAVTFRLIESAACVCVPIFVSRVWKLSFSRAAAAGVTL